MFDSTPDQALREQMWKALRYVEVDFERKVVCVKTFFLGFIQISQKDAESLVEGILKHAAKQDPMMVTFFCNHPSSLCVFLSFNTALGKTQK